LSAPTPGDGKRWPDGAAAARFGGLTSADVINAWPFGRLEEFLRKGR
jgi:hypothetical protein